MKKAEREKKFKRENTKTTEGEFIYDLRKLYELSPKLSESIYQTAKIHLLGDKQLGEGQIEITVVSIEEKSGKLTLSDSILSYIKSSMKHHNYL